MSTTEAINPDDLKLPARIKGSIKEGLIRFLEHPHLSIILAGLSVILTLPALWTGLVIDDYLHKGILQGLPLLKGLTKSRFNLFTFLDGGPQQIRDLIHKGFIPWWTFERVKLNSWRPISAFTHWLDYLFWPNSPLLMHLHSLIWMAAMIVLITLLYRRLIHVPWVAINYLLAAKSVCLA